MYNLNVYATTELNTTQSKDQEQLYLYVINMTIREYPSKPIKTHLMHDKIITCVTKKK
jgi:hypothetical protein